MITVVTIRENAQIAAHRADSTSYLGEVKLWVPIGQAPMGLAALKRLHSPRLAKRRSQVSDAAFGPRPAGRRQRRASDGATPLAARPISVGR